MSTIVPTVRPYAKPAVVSLTGTHVFVIDHPTLGMMSMSYADLRTQLDATYTAAQAACAASQSAAGASQTAAAASAATATTQASAAGVSATAAAASQVAAAASASAAGVSQTAAGVSASAAGASQTAAGVSATAANASATAAGLSETASAASASTASTQAGVSITQASNAAASAATAVASQVAAGVSETAAAGSANAAGVSQIAAAASAAAALASQTASAGSASTATAQATASANSANAAASSASTALNALALQYKGGIAGASVPATAPLAGDYYKITTAGTSQSKTWVVGDQAIYNGSSGSWTQVTGFFAAADAADIASKAALIECEGLRFDGTAGAVIGNGGIPAVGTGDFTIAFLLAPGTTLGDLISGNTNSLCAYYGGAYLGIQKLNVANGGFVTKTITEATICTYVRQSGVGQWYVANAAFGSPQADTNDYSVPSTHMMQRGDGTQKASGSLAATRAFNYALTQSEITALIGRGLVTLPEQRGGSMTALNTGGLAVAEAPTSGFASSSSTSATRNSSADSYWAGYALGRSAKAGQKFLVTFTASNWQTGTDNTICLQSGLGDPTQSNNTQITGNGAQSVVITAITNSGTYLAFRRCKFDFSGLSIIPLGTLFEQDSGQRNAGYMVRDTSGNNRHLELPETGVSIIDPADTGFIEYTRTTDGYIIGDRRVIPSTGYLVEVVATGNGTVTLGESAGTPANVCASVTLTSTPKTLPILVTQTSTGKLYCDLGTATTATFKIRLRAV